MVTASSLFGGTGSKSVPGTGRGCGWRAGGGGAVPARAATPPAAAAITAPALKAPRREMSFTTSPKYSFPDSFGSGWAQALPQRYSQVTGERPPGWTGGGGSRRSGTRPPWWEFGNEPTVSLPNQPIPTYR